MRQLTYDELNGIYKKMLKEMCLDETEVSIGDFMISFAREVEKAHSITETIVDLNATVEMDLDKTWSSESLTDDKINRMLMWW